MYLRSVQDSKGAYDVFLSLVCLLRLTEIVAPAGNYFMVVCKLCGAANSCEKGVGTGKFSASNAYKHIWECHRDFWTWEKQLADKAGS